MPPASPAALQLSQRLRQLRSSQSRLTQQMLAIAFSTEEKLSAVTVSSWESSKDPKLPPLHRLEAYARFFAVSRLAEGEPGLIPAEDLEPDENRAYKELRTELTRLRRLASGDPEDGEPTFNRSWHFPDGARVTFVCAELPRDMIGPLGKSSDPNFTELQTYADIDALVELFGHIRAENPTAAVRFRTPAAIERDELVGHLILIGGVIWNDMTASLSRMTELPVRQVTNAELREITDADPKQDADTGLKTGDIFVAEIDEKLKQFWPKWTDEDKTVLAEDVGLLARVPNPLNASRTLTICNGIHSRGVYGAVRSLTDAEMRENNERYISNQFEDPSSFAVLMLVKVLNNEAMTPDFNSPDVVLYQWSAEAA